ncbi:MULTISPECIES: ATP-binding protein [Rhodopseudomonas]|uniref:ATP-binding protein n=1 Tax=Rhodopseudomonas TaxID=1073 RepID=UPI0005CACF67|nr:MULTISPECIES: ATP-binding protein [Rhodopseudomonas]MDF3813338.1 ATP-binding protein [Rhodopseudomonas sp. BAL398]WOK17197.1 ATP-binding protein [Rhodopseudomonas sp. BAL398]
MTTISLRRTALLWMTILLAIVGLVTTIIAYRFAYLEAADFLDGELRQIALNAGPRMHAADAPGPSDQDPEDQFAIGIWDADGRLLHASPPDIQIPRQDQAGYADVRAGGELWRVYTTRNALRTVQVAQRDTVRQEIAQGTALGAAAPIIIVIPLSWLVVGWAMNRLFRRLNALADDLAQRSVAAAAPIPPQGLPTEVIPLVRGMNALIARLQDAIAAQRRFVADAAHELRTPLAAIQIQLDNLATTAPETASETRSALDDGVKRAGRLVGQLLSLARLDEAATASAEAIDLAALVLDCAGDHVALAEAKGVDLGIAIAASVTIVAPAAELRTLLDVVIDNAVRYTPAGGTIDVTLDRRDTACIVAIQDSGTGLPPGAEARIFDRFYRAAPAGIEGTGLGLAIARRIADRNGFGLTVANRADGGSGVLAQVTIPDPPSPAASHPS